MRNPDNMTHEDLATLVRGLQEALYTKNVQTRWRMALLRDLGLRFRLQESDERQLICYFGEEELAGPVSRVAAELHNCGVMKLAATGKFNYFNAFDPDGFRLGDQVTLQWRLGDAGEISFLDDDDIKRVNDALALTEEDELL